MQVREGFVISDRVALERFMGIVVLQLQAQVLPIEQILNALLMWGVGSVQTNFNGNAVVHYLSKISSIRDNLRPTRRVVILAGKGVIVVHSVVQDSVTLGDGKVLSMSMFGIAIRITEGIDEAKRIVRAFQSAMRHRMVREDSISPSPLKEELSHANSVSMGVFD